MNIIQSGRCNKIDRVYHTGKTQVVYTRFYSLVLCSLRKFRFSIEECEDIAQEVFLRYHQQSQSISEKGIKNWLVTCARNLAFDRLRTAKKRKTETCSESVDNAEISMWSDSKYATNQESLTRLFDRLQKQSLSSNSSILIDYYLGGKSTRKIANERNMNQSGVTAALSRQRARFILATREAWLCCEK